MILVTMVSGVKMKNRYLKDRLYHIMEFSVLIVPCTIGAIIVEDFVFRLFAVIIVLITLTCMIWQQLDNKGWIK